MKTEFKAIVERTTILDSIPSGSGLVLSGESLYIISDDSPYFFQLGRNYKNIRKFPVSNHFNLTDYRIPIAQKPDYESVSLGEMNAEKYLFAFGSGAKSPQRDSLLIINLKDLRQIKTYSLGHFYEHIRTAANLEPSDMNIEANVIIGDELFLFNRGHNVIIQCNWQKTLAFLTQNLPQPEIKTYRVVLPKIKGIAPGFSGACQLGNEYKILFTASVEDTPNWIDDGEILGSFIGILNLEKLASDPLENIALLTDKNGRPLIEKAESIEFLQREENGNIKTLALTDDDKGGSKILEVSLQK